MPGPTKATHSPAFFHTRDLFFGTGQFSDWPEARRRDVLTQHAEIIKKHEISVIYGCIDKPGIKAQYFEPFDPHAMSFVKCCRGIELYMRRNGRTDRWIAMVGKSDSVREDRLRDVFGRCLVMSPEGYGTRIKWSHAVDCPNFIDAQASYFFRLADFVAFSVAGFKAGKQGWGHYDLIAPQIDGGGGIRSHPESGQDVAGALRRPVLDLGRAVSDGRCQPAPEHVGRV